MEMASLNRDESYSPHPPYMTTCYHVTEVAQFRQAMTTEPSPWKLNKFPSTAEDREMWSKALERSGKFI